MDSLNTYDDACLRFYACDMVLHVDSDAAYLVCPKTRIHVAGYYYLSNHPNITKHPALNTAVHVVYKTLCHVESFSAEAECATLFYNAGVSLEIHFFWKH